MDPFSPGQLVIQSNRLPDNEKGLLHTALALHTIYHTCHTATATCTHAHLHHLPHHHTHTCSTLHAFAAPPHLHTTTSLFLPASPPSLPKRTVRIGAFFFSFSLPFDISLSLSLSMVLLSNQTIKVLPRLPLGWMPAGSGMGGVDFLRIGLAWTGRYSMTNAVW